MIQNCSAGPIDQLVRSLPCHGRGYGFKSRWDRKNRTYGQIRQIGHKNVNLKLNYEERNKSPKISKPKTITIELTFP